MTHPDEYGRPKPHKFGIVDMNDPPRPPAFLTRGREQALNNLGAELAEFVGDHNRETAAEDTRFDPLATVKDLMAALPTLKSIEVAEGIIAAGKLTEKAPTAVELAVAMATWGNGK